MTDYTFTVTLKPHLYRHEPEEQYDRTQRELIIMLKMMSNNFTLVAEVTQNANLHYHGMIELHHKKKWYSMFRKSEVFGFTTCRELTNRDGWVKYLSKDLNSTATMIERRPILRDSYNIFTLEQKMIYGTTY